MASEAEIKQKARQIRTSIKHAVNYIIRVEDGVAKGKKEEVFNEDEKRQANKVMEAIKDVKPFLDELDRAMHRH